MHVVPCGTSESMHIRRRAGTPFSAPLLLQDFEDASHEIKESASNEREHVSAVTLFDMKIGDTHVAMKLPAGIAITMRR